MSDITQIKTGDRLICLRKGKRYGKVAIVEVAETIWVETYYDDDGTEYAGYYSPHLVVKWEHNGIEATYAGSLAIDGFIVYDEKVMERITDQERRETHADKYL